ncbi:MAG: decaprenylphospho-beta-D-erythro-pentofuranosid-2-ulose 2-reductase [Acidimicrobiia bacterium]|nr:decaprenylphospho-beta-D-erythro-pentofuranosid-2-ulose 2-reductase [Acidimicrobiia bacterium]
MNDALGSVQSVLILGGGSDIALATAKALIARRCRTVILAGRDPESFSGPAKELRHAGANTVESVTFDALDHSSHPAFIESVFERFGDIDLVLVAFGVLGDQDRAEVDPTEALRILDTNFLGAVSVLVPTTAALHRQGHGTIVVLSSVAGERARRSNFVYGSSKAGLDAYCQGLGDSLVGTGVRVIVVRPGFVHSKMTDGLDAAPLATDPEHVAGAIISALTRGTEIVWVPRQMRYVMSVLRHLPRAVFRRLPV